MDPIEDSDRPFRCVGLEASHQVPHQILAREESMLRLRLLDAILPDIRYPGTGCLSYLVDCSELGYHH
jgi:hypothetical protein